MTSHTSSSTSAPSQDPGQPGVESCPIYSNTAENQTVSTVRTKIAASASLNSSLLSTLMSTMDAPVALGHLNTHLSILQAEFSAHETALDALRDKALQALRRHELFRDSKIRRLTYRVTAMAAKFRDKAQAAEKEYTQTVQELSRAETRQKLLASKLQDVEREQAELEKQAQKHGEAHAKIDELYESIFAGPTPGFMEEDRREGEYFVALQQHEHSKTQLLATRRALRALTQAGNALKRSGGSLVHALRAVDASFFLALSGVEGEIGVHEHYRTTALLLVEKTDESLRPVDPKFEDVKRRLSTAIRGSVVNLEDVSSKQILLDSIARAGKTLNQAGALLDELKVLAKGMEKAAGQHLALTARTLEDVRQSLQQIRQEAFEKVVGFGAAAPAYHECCDRASRFEEIDNEGNDSSSTDGAAAEELDTSPAYEAYPQSHPQTPGLTRESVPNAFPPPMASDMFIPGSFPVGSGDAWTLSQKHVRG